MHLSVEQYRQQLMREHGHVDEELVRAYAEKRRRHKLGKFNPFTSDPGCKTCKKASSES
jgi:hypothetical protein